MQQNLIGNPKRATSFFIPPADQRHFISRKGGMTNILYILT